MGRILSCINCREEFPLNFLYKFPIIDIKSHKSKFFNLYFVKLMKPVWKIPRRNKWNPKMFREQSEIALNHEFSHWKIKFKQTKYGTQWIISNYLCTYVRLVRVAPGVWNFLLEFQEVSLKRLSNIINFQFASSSSKRSTPIHFHTSRGKLLCAP